MDPNQRSSGPSAANPSGGLPRVKTVACLAGVSLERGVPIEEIADTLRDVSNVVWMDVQDPGPTELAMLEEQFGFHPLALADVARGQQRPKVDEYKGYLFVVTYGLLPGSDSTEMPLAEVNLFIGRNYVVSTHRGAVPALDEALSRWMRGGAMLREGVGFVVYTVMDVLIGTYLPPLDRIEDEVDAAELEMFTRFRQEEIQNLLNYKRSLVMLRRVLVPLRETIHVFQRRDHPYFSANTVVYFKDIHDQLLRLVDMLEIERDRITSVMEAFLAVLSNRLNRTMKTLTVFTVCVAIIGSVFGAWGMNFTAIPLAETPWGFPAVVGGALALVGLYLSLARWRKWL